MRTIIWLLKAVIYMISVIPDMKKAKKLNESEDREAFLEVVDHRVQHFAHTMLKNAGVTVEVHGAENFTGRPSIIVANHQSDFDIPILLAHMDKPYGMVAKLSLKKIPLISTWMEYIGCTFIDRSDARQSLRALNDAAKQIPEGRSVVIFPEGTRSKGEPVAEFGSGAFKAAFKYNAPVIPVSIDGSYKIFEGNSGKRIKPGHVILTVLPAIETEGMDKAEQRALPEKIRADILAAREASRASYKTNSL